MGEDSKTSAFFYSFSFPPYAPTVLGWAAYAHPIPSCDEFQVWPEVSFLNYHSCSFVTRGQPQATSNINSTPKKGVCHGPDHSEV